MDRPNLELVARALDRGYQVTAVSHDVDPVLERSGAFEFWRVPRPLSSVLLGEVFLERMGRKARQRYPSATFIANGGNFPGADLNWVHYVHAAEKVPPPPHLFSRVYASVRRRRNIRRERRALGTARLVVTDSRLCAADVIAALGLPAARVRAVYYGADHPRSEGKEPDQRGRDEVDLGFTVGEQRCLFIGGLGDRRKGLETLLEAWALLQRDGGWQVKLLVAGAGKRRAEYEQHAERLRLGAWVQFLGFRSDVPRLLEISDCVVAPTHYEPYGLGVQEAFCAGIPAIVTASAGIAERYPPELRPLLLADAGDPQALANCLRGWHHARASYRSLASAFGQELLRRSWKDMADEMLSLVTG
jgi:glycosyltransferase involved in cell wall biosynthesis